MNDAYVASGKSWTDFKESADFVDIAKELKAYNEKAKQEVADILGIDKDEVLNSILRKTMREILMLLIKMIRLQLNSNRII